MERGLEFYTERIDYYNSKIEKNNSVLNIMALIRLAIVIGTIVLGYYFYNIDKKFYLILTVVIGLIMLIIAVIYYKKIENKNKEFKGYIDINKKGIKRIKGEWKQFEDKGEEFLDLNHEYVNDLDIFGEGSLFQLINTCKTKFGRISLARKLKGDNRLNRKEILELQDAIQELSEKVKWRQKLYVEGIKNNSGSLEIDNLLRWCEMPSINTGKYKNIAYIFVAITMIMLFMVIVGKISFSYLLLQLMINFVVIKLCSKSLENVIEIFHIYKNDIIAYGKILSVIESEKFESDYLKKIKTKLYNDGIVSAVFEMKKLNNLIDWIGDSTSNPYYLIINLFIMSDIFIVYNIETWKKSNGKYILEWLNTIGEFEALSSISNLDFDNPNWEYPEIKNTKIVSGSKIGHPLLKNAISNDYSLCENRKVTLITGSNMSGKSTFLRTIGINLVLSYLGAPTYSESFKCGVFRIYTCMRTMDNLEESISSFYAEILRIKYLIESSKRGEEVFFLLDEIFKGTNSIDRHEGATVLIKQLIDAGAIGIVSTHDLELCKLEKEDNRIVNYNFREYYDKNDIKFDYILRSGESKTRNAIHLMRLAGIDFK